MKGTFKAGAEFDLVSPSEMADMLDTHAEKLAKLIHEKGQSRRWPALRFISAHQVSTAATQDVQIGPVPLGWAWDIAVIRVCGADPTTTIQGAATVFQNEVQPSNYRDGTTRIPASVQSGWREHQFVVRSGELLIVRFSGLTGSGVDVWATAAVEEYRMGTED